MHELIDNYNRHINYLRISVTDRCNLRCVYCMPEEGVPMFDHKEVLSYEEILRIARIVASRGISKVRITGGEPLVRKGIAGFLSELCDIPGLTDISMTTNGILLQAAAGALRKAGMQRINISLDTLDPVKFRKITRGGNIQSVLAGIHEARLVGFKPIKINLVVMRGINEDEILSFAELTIERPVHVRFIEFMPVHNHNTLQRDYFVSNSEIRNEIADNWNLATLSDAENTGPAQMYQIQGALGRLGFISPLSNHFCATCNRLRLTCDGKLRTCLFSNDEVDLKSTLRAGCSDAVLQSSIANAILLKPMRHKILEPSYEECTRRMSAIGG